MSFHDSDLPPGVTPTDHIIEGFGHVWRVCIKPDVQYEASTNPPPFEAYGKHAHFLREKCLDPSSCAICVYTTLELAREQMEKRERIFEHYNVLFGIKRNKALSIQVKKNKANEMELESSSSEEEEELVEEEEEDEDEEEEEKEEDDEEDEVEVEEEEEEEEDE